MDRKRKIVYTVLAMIPTLLVLILLACIHPLLLLVGLIVLLTVLLILKWKWPGLFDFSRKDKADTPLPPPSTSSSSRKTERVYMVLAAPGGPQARRIEVDREKFTIGRADDNDCVLKGDRISRAHLQIVYNQEDGACYVMDLGSKNGTYLNLERLRSNQSYILREGDKLMIDDLPFTVQYAHY